MDQLSESTLHSMNKAIIDRVQSKANSLRANIDWVQVQFCRNYQGQIIGLQSDDLELHHWLQQLKIERNDIGTDSQPK